MNLLKDLLSLEVIIVGMDAIINLSKLIIACGFIGGIIFWCFRFVERQKQQGKEIEAIRREQTFICYGILACLKGLPEQSCNGPVTEALNKMEKYLNETAHGDNK